MLPKQEPSLSSIKLKPPLESRRVRTQPFNSICRPMLSGLRAWATLSFSMRHPPAEGPATGVIDYFTLTPVTVNPTSSIALVTSCIEHLLLSLTVNRACCMVTSTLIELGSTHGRDVSASCTF